MISIKAASWQLQIAQIRDRLPLSISRQQDHIKWCHVMIQRAWSTQTKSLRFWPIRLSFETLLCCLLSTKTWWVFGILLMMNDVERSNTLKRQGTHMSSSLDQCHPLLAPYARPAGLASAALHMQKLCGLHAHCRSRHLFLIAISLRARLFQTDQVWMLCWKHDRPKWDDKDQKITGNQ